MYKRQVENGLTTKSLARSIMNQTYTKGRVLCNCNMSASAVVKRPKNDEQSVQGVNEETCVADLSSVKSGSACRYGCNLFRKHCVLRHIKDLVIFGMANCISE